MEIINGWDTRQPIGSLTDQHGYPVYVMSLDELSWKRALAVGPMPSPPVLRDGDSMRIVWPAVPVGATSAPTLVVDPTVHERNSEALDLYKAQLAAYSAHCRDVDAQIKLLRGVP